jgi:hypothetical protein
MVERKKPERNADHEGFHCFKQNSRDCVITRTLWEVIAPHLSASFTLDPSALTLG